jgi:hypothetical protein
VFNASIGTITAISWAKVFGSKIIEKLNIEILESQIIKKLYIEILESQLI